MTPRRGGASGTASSGSLFTGTSRELDAPADEHPAEPWPDELLADQLSEEARRRRAHSSSNSSSSRRLNAGGGRAPWLSHRGAPRLRAASDLARRRHSASSPESAMVVQGLPAARNRAARWGIGWERGGGRIGFRPASAPQTRSYSGSGVAFAGCGKTFYGPDTDAGFGLARKMGRTRIIARIMRVCAGCGVC